MKGNILGTMTYVEYINSWYWKDKVELIKSLIKKCQRCGGIKNLQVHHLHYKSLGNESSKDLELLCRDCHRKAHNLNVPLRDKHGGKKIW